MIRKIIPYNPRLRELARQLRNSSTKAEIKLWKQLSNKKMLGFDFQRQKPIDEYIVDFFCYELMLAIELDGLTHQWDEVYKKDVKKEEKITELGITVMRFNDDQVMNDIENVLLVIEDYAMHYGK